MEWALTAVVRNRHEVAMARQSLKKRIARREESTVVDVLDWERLYYCMRANVLSVRISILTSNSQSRDGGDSSVGM